MDDENIAHSFGRKKERKQIRDINGGRAKQPRNKRKRNKGKNNPCKEIIRILHASSIDVNLFKLLGDLFQQSGVCAIPY